MLLLETRKIKKLPGSGICHRWIAHHRVIRASLGTPFECVYKFTRPRRSVGTTSVRSTVCRPICTQYARYRYNTGGRAEFDKILRASESVRFSHIDRKSQFFFFLRETSHSQDLTPLISKDLFFLEPTTVGKLLLVLTKRNCKRILQK